MENTTFYTHVRKIITIKRILHKKKITIFNKIVKNQNEFNAICSKRFS